MSTFTQKLMELNQRMAKTAMQKQAAYMDRSMYMYAMNRYMQKRAGYGKQLMDYMGAGQAAPQMTKVDNPYSAQGARQNMQNRQAYEENMNSAMSRANTAGNIAEAIDTGLGAVQQVGEKVGMPLIRGFNKAKDWVGKQTDAAMDRLSGMSGAGQAAPQMTKVDNPYSAQGARQNMQNRQAYEKNMNSAMRRARLTGRIARLFG